MIALEEIDHTWDEDEVREFRKMWRKNIPVVEMVEYFERPIVELAVLIMDQELKGNIIPRAMGL